MRCARCPAETDAPLCPACIAAEVDETCAASGVPREIPSDLAHRVASLLTRRRVEAAA